MNGIEQAIEKMVQDATADLRERVRRLEAFADVAMTALEALTFRHRSPPRPPTATATDRITGRRRCVARQPDG